MPKFVWEITSRGRWAPSLFAGELPREIMAPHNRDRYRVHELTEPEYEAAMQGIGQPSWRPLDHFAAIYPPPDPEPRVILTRIETTVERIVTDVD